MAKSQTKRIRYSQLSALFNFIRNNLDRGIPNSCDTPMMKKLFRNRPPVRWNTIEKDTVDEIIFETTPRYLGKVCDVEAIRWIDNLCS